MPSRYPNVGDLDKPFHPPKCECMYCEAWRTYHYSKQDEESKPDASTDEAEAGRQRSAIDYEDWDHFFNDPYYD